MKKVMKMLGIFSLVLGMVFSIAACDESGNPATDPDDDTVIVSRSVTPINKFKANAFTGNDSDRIKYSYSYGGYDFYYIYLGELTNIPMFNFSTQRHNGYIKSTYNVTVTEETKNSVTQTISTSSQTVISTVNEHTTSTSTGGKAGVEISARFPISLISVGTKVKAEEHWNNCISDTTSTTVQQTTSLTNTVEYASSYARTTMESRTFVFSSDIEIGFYRYTMFSNSDVYLYVIRDSATGEIVEYEFKEYVIPDSYYWDLDYSETLPFKKNDSTGFEIDISILENLPQPKLDFSGIQFEQIKEFDLRVGTSPSIFIPSTITKAVIIGEYNRIYTNSEIIVAQRESPLTIEFNNVYAVGKNGSNGGVGQNGGDGRPFISMGGNMARVPDLTIISSGILNELRGGTGGDGGRGNDNKTGARGGNGGAAILADKITITGDVNIVLIGGNGGNGGRGGNLGTSLKGTSGGNGGNGGTTISADNITVNISGVVSALRSEGGSGGGVWHGSSGLASGGSGGSKGAQGVQFTSTPVIQHGTVQDRR